MAILKAFLAVLLVAIQVSSLATLPTSDDLLNWSVVPAAPRDCTIRSYKQIASVVASCTNITVRANFEIPRIAQPLNITLQPGTIMTFMGNIFFDLRNVWTYLMEISGNNITVVGTNTHQFHGVGELYWDSKGKGGVPKPTFLRVKAQNSSFIGLKIKNCPLRCVEVDQSNNVVLKNFEIDNRAGAPETAKPGKEAYHTEGFNVTKSQYVTIQNSTVYTQDDCVVITSGAHMLIDNLNCYGSHGINIGTGKSKTDQSRNAVKNITFQNSNLYNGTYGAHILTYADGGKGYVQDITYSNITLNGPSDFGIMIQQDFSIAQNGSTGIPVGNVPISNVKFNGITGSMNGGVQNSFALSIRCAAGACSNINLNNVKINNASSANECLNYKISGWC